MSTRPKKSKAYHAPPPDDRVELVLVPERSRAFQPPDNETRILASASRAVPLLWLGLFDRDEAEVRPSGRLDVFAAAVPARTAAKRAEALSEALPEEPGVLRETARILAYELGEAPEGHHVALFPENMFRALSAGTTRTYLEQLFDLCQLWQEVREGLSWPEAESRLDRIFPEVTRLVSEHEPRVGGYYLVGSLVDRLGDLEPFRVREGQGPQDVEPEALAVGEMGLLLGRFEGTWKLMSSQTEEDLHGVWSDGKIAFLVGNRGTVQRLRNGSCTNVMVPTNRRLNHVWGLGSRFICAVGDGGDVVAYDGRNWHLWPVPTESPLHAVAGTGPDNICVAGQEPAVFRFDGHAWSRIPLPDEGLVNALGASDGTVVAAGGSTRGGVLYRLDRGRWIQEPGTPRSDWLEGLWSGWGDELGVLAGTASALVRSKGTWSLETLPADRVTAVASGAHVMAAGTSGRYEVILRRAESGWCVEASLVGLRLKQIWVAGRPRPPRRRAEQDPAEASTHDTMEAR
jgi:hypothetical protein